MTRISERNDALLQDIVANTKVFESFSKSFDPKKQNIYNDPRVPIMYRTLNFFDELLYYRHKGSINKGTFKLYQKTFQMFLDKNFAKSFWKHVREEYSLEFQKMVDEAIRSQHDGGKISHDKINHHFRRGQHGFTN